MDLKNGIAAMKVGIVGSRRRTDRTAIEACVVELEPETVVVSGGARGPDQWAAEMAQRRGMSVIVLGPQLGLVRSCGEAARRYHARNQEIVDTADRIIAFVAPDRSGGTEDTIRRARRAGKAVEIR
jgi:hypothetical protein